MARRCRARRDEALGDAEGHPGPRRGRAPARRAPSGRSSRPDARRRTATGYVEGPLSDPGAAAAGAIADLHDRDRPGLRKVIGPADRGHGPLRAARARPVGAGVGEPDGVRVFDPSAFPEGAWPRSGWGGRLGPLENGRVGIHRADGSRRERARADGRLDRPKAGAAGGGRPRGPGAVGSHTRHGRAPEVLDGGGPAIPHGRVSGDDKRGRLSGSRWGGRARVTGGPPRRIRRSGTRPPRPAVSRRRPPAARPLRAGGGRPPGRRAGGRRSESGTGRRGRRWRRPPGHGSRPGPTPGRRTRRGGGWCSGSSRGMWTPGGRLSKAPLAPPRAAFARVSEARHRIGGCVKRAEGEAGPADSRVRTWAGWHPHQALSPVAAWSLTREARRGEMRAPARAAPLEGRLWRGVLGHTALGHLCRFTLAGGE